MKVRYSLSVKHWTQGRINLDWDLAKLTVYGTDGENSEYSAVLLADFKFHFIKNELWDSKAGIRTITS